MKKQLNKWQKQIQRRRGNMKVAEAYIYHSGNMILNLSIFLCDMNNLVRT